MKINYDCIRSLLLTLEENLVFDDKLNFPTIMFKDVCSFLQDKYSIQDIAYSTEMLCQADYIEATVISGDNQFSAIYSGLTFSGHQYLDGIRSDLIWSKIFKKVKEKGISLTFEVITSCAKALLITTITS